MKKLISIICSAGLLAAAAISFSACGGQAVVTYKLSEDGTHYIVSGISGRSGSLTKLEIPEKYSAEEGGELLPVTEIGYEAFMRCSSLYSVSLPDCIEKIDVRAFMGCGFTKFAIPESVTEIGFAAFGRCTSLKEIVIPQSVAKLDDLAFAYCSSLQTAVVKADIEILPEKTFVNSYVVSAGQVYTSTSLTKVYLPATLKKIYANALDGNMLEDIYFAGSEQQWDELYFYERVKKEGTDNEYEEKRVKKEDVIGNKVNVHFNAEYSQNSENQDK